MACLVLGCFECENHDLRVEAGSGFTKARAGEVETRADVGEARADEGES